MVINFFKKIGFKGALYFLIILIIFINALIQIQINKNFIKEKFRKYIYASKEVDYLKNDPISDNPLKRSNRQAPPINYQDLKLNKDDFIIGAWTAPFDFNISQIHAALLQDGTVLSYGTLSAKEFSSDGKDIVKNKKVILSNNYEVGRDNGDHQWANHEVQTGVDFDIWDRAKGFDANSHTVYHRPLIFDSFCSIVRTYDEELVFILGGNKQEPHPDTQKGTVFYNIKEKQFTSGSDLHYARWYGSLIRLEDDSFLIVGGGDITHNYKGKKVLPSSIPELFVQDNNGAWSWKELKHLESDSFFGRLDEEEWHYPKSFLISDGSIGGTSYNKIWKIEKDLSSVKEVGRIPLVKENIKVFLSKEYKNPKKEENKNIEVNNSVIGVLSAAVGHTSSSIMIGKDKIFQMGGVQMGEFLSSNQSNIIDFSDSDNPKVTRASNMHYPRMWHNSLILADGNVFVHGGYLLEDNEFTWYEPEIYDVKSDTWTLMRAAHFKRNYHASALLLPDATVMVGGADMWNAEIFYPPYLFEEVWDGVAKFAPRPKIVELKTLITERGEHIIKTENSSDIQKISLISNGSSTHSQNSELKVIYPEFKKIDSQTISFKIDHNKNYVQNGSYLLFLINNKGTPSIGKVITIK